MDFQNAIRLLTVVMAKIDDVIQTTIMQDLFSPILPSSSTFRNFVQFLLILSVAPAATLSGRWAGFHRDGEHDEAGESPALPGAAITGRK